MPSDELARVSTSAAKETGAEAQAQAEASAASANGGE